MTKNTTSGILNIHKPSGPTSFAVVARVRKLTGESKIGHGGTLDPLASGVLPVFLGQATRLSEYLLEYRKVYRASIMLGVATDSYDAEGVVTARGDVSTITREDIENVLRGFCGEIRQTPPEYSAVKYKGKPLYKLAREGRLVEIQSRMVTIYRLELRGFTSPMLDLEIECSKGTYIRSLAHDMGQMLGCGAHLAGLVRTSYGPFDINQAISLEQLEAATSDGSWMDLMQPMDSVLSLWQSVTLSDTQIEAVRCGGLLPLQIDGISRLCAYDDERKLVALLEYDSVAGAWHPRKVFCSYYPTRLKNSA